MSAVKRWGIAAAGPLILVLLYCISRIDDPRESIPLFFGLFAAAFAVYLSALLLIMRLKKSSRRLITFIIVITIFSRGVLLFNAPLLSNDAYRYLWEGRIILAGFNPFSHAPNSSDLKHLRNDDYANINHKELETIYPPLAQGIFALGAAIHPDVRVQKLLFVLFDIGTLLVLLRLLALRGENTALCAVYGWSPLAALEFAHSGHLDPIAIFFMMLGILLIIQAKKLSGMIMLALSFLAKYASGLLLPHLICRKRAIGWSGVFVAVIVLGYVPFAGASGGLFSSLRIYAGQWEFNSAPFGIIKELGGHPLWIRRGLLALLIAFILWQSLRRLDLLRFAYLVIGCSLLLTPTVYPWYVTWILPFLCFYPNKAWLLFTGLVIGSYWSWPRLLSSNEWTPGTIVMLIEYIPFYGLLIVEGLRARNRQRLEVGCP